jgi:catechol 2,3-dioxygenase-like lactoylglutathione lyase family enzyme
MTLPFPAGFTAAQIRIARPTDQLEAVVAFWRDGLGLETLGAFAGHDGYDGVMLGLPDRGLHLEFTHHRDGSPCPAPTRDNLLVLYVPDEADYAAVLARFAARGVAPVEPENSYWRDKSATFEDPDGWRLVICRVMGV